MSANPSSASSSSLLGARPMSGMQIAIIGLCVALNMLDGFDVLAISFAAPGIATEWGIDRAVLGVVLSMELFGMAAGSVLIGRLADRIGRRPVILGCLCVMAIGMLAASQAWSVPSLSAARLLTGVGIGGMLASTSAMVAELANDRRRGLAAALNIAGYSAGAILGGLVATRLLAVTGDWRSVFLFGGIATLVLLPVTALLLPESIDFARTRDDALAKVNRILARLRQPPLDALSPIAQDEAAPSLFRSGYGIATLLLTVAYFAQIMLFYYVQKWIPKIVADMGFDAAQAGHVLIGANVGSLSGAILVGVASQYLPLRATVIAAMLLGFVAIGLFGLGTPDLVYLTLTAGVAAFFINAGVVGLYPVFAQTFPSALRASGTGFVIGIGRGGSAVGPMIVGVLFAHGASLLAVSLIMGCGGLVAATMVALLRPIARGAPDAA